ncbi:hypothetical protein B0H19DRAFT_1143795 [Mycena capillaripes]|nr:hypothetical protein B0H19DRAFT_1143795 [Mycena capillaripes]
MEFIMGSKTRAGRIDDPSCARMPQRGDPIGPMPVNGGIHNPRDNDNCANAVNIREETNAVTKHTVQHQSKKKPQCHQNGQKHRQNESLEGLGNQSREVGHFIGVGEEQRQSELRQRQKNLGGEGL